MNRFKIGVVEDEVIIGDHIVDALQELGYEVVGPVINYTEGLELLEREQPDLLLLDIVLSGNKDGIDLALKMREKHDIPFIFLTSHADQATVNRAKAAGPSAYLVKPFNKEEIYTAIEIALHNYSRGQRLEELPEKNSDRQGYMVNNAIFVKNKNVFNKVLYDDIIYLKSDHVYIDIFTTTNKHVVRSSMSEYLEKLPPDRFFRVQRSYIINAAYLEAINPDYVVVAGERLPVSKDSREQLMNLVRLG